jgi:hypothetical protein
MSEGALQAIYTFLGFILDVLVNNRPRKRGPGKPSVPQVPPKPGRPNLD